MFIPAHEWLCQTLVDESHMAIIVGDVEGRIRLWNKGAEEMFGWTADEAFGQSLDIIIPVKHRTRHWQGYKHVMQTGVTKYGRNPLAVPAQTKDGRRISIEFFVSLLHSQHGELLGIAAIMQDVTDRRKREKALHSRLAALEGHDKTD